MLWDLCANRGWHEQLELYDDASLRL